MDITPCATDDDYEQWRQVRIAVLPYERTASVAELREQLRRVPVDDKATWAQVAHETAGAFAVWSLRVETTPGPLAATARSLAQSAQVRTHELSQGQSECTAPVRARCADSAAASRGSTVCCWPTTPPTSALTATSKLNCAAFPPVIFAVSAAGMFLKASAIKARERGQGESVCG